MRWWSLTRWKAWRCRRRHGLCGPCDRRWGWPSSMDRGWFRRRRWSTSLGIAAAWWNSISPETFGAPERKYSELIESSQHEVDVLCSNYLYKNITFLTGKRLKKIRQMRPKNLSWCSDSHLGAWLVDRDMVMVTFLPWKQKETIKTTGSPSNCKHQNKNQNPNLNSEMIRPRTKPCILSITKTPTQEIP